MKRNLFIPKTALAFLMVLFSVWGWGQTVNITPTRTDVSGFTSWTDSEVAGSSYLQLLKSTSFTITPAMNFNQYSNQTLDFKARTFGGVNATENLLTISISVDDGNTWSVLGTRTPTSTTLTAQTQFNLSSYSGTAVKIRFSVGGTNDGIGVGIDDITIQGTVNCTTPATPNGIISGSQTACSSTNLSYAYGVNEPISGLSYYWQTSATGTDNTNSAANQLNVTNSGSYYVRAYNGTCWSSATSAYNVTINSNPVVGTQPSNQTAVAPAAVTFSLSSTGTNTYQWQVNKNDGNGFVNVTDGTGANTSSYTTASTTASMNGYQYQAIVTNTCGTVTSSVATLFVTIPAANDLCSSATVLTAGMAENGNLVNSTFTTPFNKKDVWYKFVPSLNGSYTFTVSGFKVAPNNTSADVDTELFDGVSCPTTTTYLSNSNTSTNVETITRTLTAGTTYYLRVLAYNTQAESSTFSVLVTAPQPCVTPSVATSLVLAPTSNSIGATFTAAASASGYLAIISTSSTLSATPQNGTTYNVGDSFGGGTVVKFSSGNTFTASNLTQTTNYYLFVYSYNNQCGGEPYYSTTALQGNSTTLAGPCVVEDFTGNNSPTGWAFSNANVTGNYLNFGSANGSVTTSSYSYLGEIRFKLTRTDHATAKTMNVLVSTTSQSSGFTTIATYTHSNTVTDGDTQISIDLSQYSAYPNVYIKFEKVSTTTSPWRIDDVQIYCSGVWNGTAWTISPSAATNVVINGTYSTSTSPAFTAKNITIQNGGVLEITDGNTINAADVTVENGGNLIQRGNGALSYSGTFKVNKTGATLADKYTFWASPVASQNLNNIYATTPAFITQYDTPTNTFVNSPSATASIIGKGYSIKNPSANAAVSFTGAPNNGAQTLSLDNSSFGYNLVGNPYPSDLNLGAFYTANAARITSTFYFWDTNSSGLNNNPGYAVFNAANGANPTWIAAPNTTSASPAGDVAKVGQGFIVKAIANTPLTFDNTMRSAGTATFFNKNNSLNEGKYWLKLSSSYNTNNTIAVTYFAGASNAYDIYDSKALGLGVDALYATADAEKVVIQGRGAFIVSDIVPIASKHATTANFNIALTQKEGVFDNGQAIYLHDKVLGTYTNLQNTSYNFTANAGEVTDRFEVVYQLGTLSTSEAQKGEFEIYRDGNDFYARNSKNIDKIEVYDAAGRKIQDMNIASQLVKIQLDAKGFYIIKAKSAGKEYTKKITY